MKKFEDPYFGLGEPPPYEQYEAWREFIDERNRRYYDSLSDLEKKYLETKKSTQDEIQKKLNEASLILNQAELIAEKHGVPFDSHISPLYQSYRPKSFDTIWEGIDPAVDDNLPDYSGWEHSAICY